MKQCSPDDGRRHLSLRCRVLLLKVRTVMRGKSAQTIVSVILLSALSIRPAVGKLVAHYPLNEAQGTSIADASGNGHNGTLTGSGAQWVDGPAGFGKALRFPGNKTPGPVVNAGKWDPSAGTNKLTVAAWIKWEGPTAYYQGIVGKRDAWNATDTCWALSLNQSDGSIGFSRYDCWPWFGTNIPTANQWQHIAVTFDGTTAILYVGGREVGRSSTFSFGPKRNASVVFGDVDPVGYNPFHGAIDEVRIYDTPLTASQIQDLLLPPPQPVVLGDPKLKAAVESALGVTNPTADDMLRLTSLTANKQGISSLTGLECATNLKTLLIGENSIADLTPLKDLTRMETLQAQSNQIQDVSPLRNMVALTNLYLPTNQISDIGPLAGLTKLTSLTLGYNPIQNVSALRNMTVLTRCDLPSCQITDISPLVGLTKLTRLALASNTIQDVSALRNMNALTELYLYSNQITDISPLAGLTSLTYLNLSENTIKDVSALAGMIAMNRLNLYYNNITDISPLATLTKIDYLDLISNRIEDVSALEDMTALTSLHLTGNQITDISPLAGLNKLARLSLGWNQIEDISWLTGLTGLANASWGAAALDLRSNPLTYSSCCVYVPRIQANNPGATILHDCSYDCSNPPPYSGGSGTVADPYQIATAEALIYLGNTTRDYSKHFILTVDVDLAGYTFDHAVISPDVNESLDVTSCTPFTGIFNGNGHTIRNLHIEGSQNLGLFGRVGQCSIMNLGLEDVSIQGTDDCVGGLVGYNEGVLSNCYSTGTVTGDEFVGGLVGENWPGSLSNCYSGCAVSGGSNVIGGLVGYSYGNVSNCYSTGAVTGEGWDVGGLVGLNVGRVSNCYSTGNVIGGVRDISGLVGRNYFGTISSSFWDIQTSGLTQSAGGTGLSTAAMQDINTYLNAGWDFVNEIVNGPNDVWTTPVAGGYPILAWQHTGPAAIAHWPFDEISGNTAVDIVGGFDGVVSGATWTSGTIGGALQFNGEGASVDCGKAATLAPAVCTISFWVRPGMQYIKRSLLRKSGWGTYEKEHDISLTGSGQLVYAFGNGSQIVTVQTASKLPTNQWSHVAVRRDGAEAAIYINGVKAASASYSFAPADNGRNLVLGGGATDSFAGTLDDIRIYDQAIDEEEIAALASQM
jgi:Leucine-rich repeat (LRR) protein